MGHVGVGTAAMASSDAVVQFSGANSAYQQTPTTSFMTRQAHCTPSLDAVALAPFHAVRISVLRAADWNFATGTSCAWSAVGATLHAMLLINTLQ